MSFVAPHRACSILEDEYHRYCGTSAYILDRHQTNFLNHKQARVLFGLLHNPSSYLQKLDHLIEQNRPFLEGFTRAEEKCFPAFIGFRLTDMKLDMGFYTHCEIDELFEEHDRHYTHQVCSDHLTDQLGLTDKGYRELAANPLNYFRACCAVPQPNYEPPAVYPDPEQPINDVVEETVEEALREEE